MITVRAVDSRGVTLHMMRLPEGMTISTLSEYFPDLGITWLNCRSAQEVVEQLITATCLFEAATVTWIRWVDGQHCYGVGMSIYEITVSKLREFAATLKDNPDASVWVGRRYE